MMARSTGVSDIKDNQETIKTTQVATNDIILYPNPVKDWLNIALPDKSALLNIAVYNINGEQVATARSTTIPVSGLAAGTYFVEIQLADGKRITKKVIISRN